MYNCIVILTNVIAFQLLKVQQRGTFRMLTIGMIEDCFRWFQPSMDQTVNIKEYCNLDGIKLITSAHFDHVENFAYICEISRFKAFASEISGMKNTLFIVVFHELALSERVSECPNTIFVCAENTVDIYVRIIEMYINVTQWAERLEMALIEKKSLQEIVVIAGELLINPFIILDSSLSVLAYTEKIDADDATFRRTIELGYTPLDVVEKITRQRKNSKARQYGNVRFPGNTLYASPPDLINNYNKLFRNISDAKGTVVAGIYMHCTVREETAGQRDLLEYFADIVTHYFQNPPEHEREVEMDSFDYERYFLYILEGRHVEDITPSELASRMGLPLEGEFNLFVMCSINTVSGQYVLRQVREKLLGIKCVLYHGNIVGILGFKYKYIDKQEQIDSVMNQVLELTETLEGITGRSMSFSSLLDLRIAYKQALKAAELGEKFRQSTDPYNSFNLQNIKHQRVFCYDDEYLHHMVLCYGNEAALSSLCVPQLFRLLELDRKNHTDNYKVLYVYLENDRKTTDVAKILHMHRNNVNYRIKRIEELFDLNLEDKNIRLRIQVSFRVLDLL